MFFTFGRGPTGARGGATAFISYSRIDIDVAMQFYRLLQQRDVVAWIDGVDVDPGSNWEASIEHAIEQCTHMVVLISPNSVRSDEVSAEWNLAVARGKVVIPVIIGAAEVPFRLRSRQWVDIRDSSLAGVAARLSAQLPRFRRGPRFVVDTSGGEALIPDGYAAVTVSADPGEELVVAVRPDCYESFQKLLDDIYVQYLSRTFKPHTYGRDWVLSSFTTGPVPVPFEWVLEPGTGIQELNSGWAGSVAPSQILMSAGEVYSVAEPGEVRPDSLYGVATDSIELIRAMLAGPKDRIDLEPYLVEQSLEQVRARRYAFEVVVPGLFWDDRGSRLFEGTTPADG